MQLFVVQDELRAAVLENTITTLPMFTHCNKSFLQAIMRSLQQKLYSRRSVLLDSCVPEGWYLVKTGSVRVMDVATAQVQIKYAGHSFAEKALFSDINSVAIEVQCAYYCYTLIYYTVVIVYNMCCVYLLYIGCSPC